MEIEKAIADQKLDCSLGDLGNLTAILSSYYSKTKTENLQI